jgi:hypothetical protein
MIPNNRDDDVRSQLASDIMETRIYDYLRRKSGVSLAEMTRDVMGFRGDDVWETAGTNVVIWSGMSRAAITAMLELIRSEKIVPTVSNLLVYAFDGSVLDMPIARGTRKKYTKPHWLPTVFAGNRVAA